MAMRRAADARVIIDGVPIPIQRFRVGGRSPAINVSNTEALTGNPAGDTPPNGGFVSKLPDLSEGEVEITTATFDDDIAYNPFGATIAVVDGEWYDIQVYPSGLTGPFHNLGNVLCTSCDHSGSIPGPQPVTLRFETDGEYRYAGETG